MSAILFFCHQCLMNVIYYLQKKKGVAGLIQIENPNRRQLKAKKLATLNESLDTAEPAQLSRRERLVKSFDL